MKKWIWILLAATSLASASEGGGEGGGGSNFVKLDPLVVNLKGGSYIQFVPQLKLHDPKDLETVKAYTPVIRFLFIKSMLGQDGVQVQTPAFINSFADTAASTINKALDGDYVKGVFFENWIVQ